jgi:hypothetical protein
MIPTVPAMPASARPISGLAAAAALGLEAARIARRVARGRAARTGEVVSAEYDAGYWSDALRDAAWRRCPTVEDYVAPRAAGTRLARIQNRLVRIPHRDYYQYRGDVLRLALRESAASATELVELGCGHGVNLFSLACDPHWTRLTGLDISASALEAARQAAAHFGLSGTLHFRPLDLLASDHPSWPMVRGATVFTYYSFEQLKRGLRAAVDNVLRAAPARVIHFEVTPELWGLNPSDLVNRLYIWSQDYQSSLLTILRALERDGRLRILDIRRLFYAPGLRNDASLICWEPR